MDRRKFLKTVGFATIAGSLLPASSVLGGITCENSPDGLNCIDSPDSTPDPSTAIQPDSGLPRGLHISKYADVVNVKHYGAVGDGINDDAPAIQDAIDNCKQMGFPYGTRAIYFPTGRYRLNSTLTVYDHTKLIGENPIDTGTEFWFYGGSTDNCMQSFAPATLEKGMFWMHGIRVKDKRTAPVSGSGLVLENFKNSTRLYNIEISDFPTYQFHFTALPGDNCDRLEVLSSWFSVKPSMKNSTMILIERATNNLSIDRCYFDNLGDGCDGIVIGDNTGDDNAVINISNCSFEVDNSITSPSIVLGESHGNVSISNVIQTAVGKGSNVVQVNDGFTGRLTLRAVVGERHQTWGVAPHVLNIDNSSMYLDGHIDYAVMNAPGYPVRVGLGGLGTPESKVYGVVGETFHRFDGGAGSVLYVKESGHMTNTGWVGK